MQLFNRCYQFLIYGLLAGGIFSMNAQENAGAPETEHSIKISQWLKTEPFSAPVPALAGDDFKLSQMLGFEPVDIATITNDQLGLSWSELAADESGNAQLSGSGDQPQVIWLAAYLETDRFAKATLKLQTAHLARVYLDGQKIAEKSSSENEEPGKIEEKLTLETGKHVLVVKSLRDPKNESKWQLSGSISTTSDAVITVSTSPKKIVDAHQLLDRTMIRGVSISADGKIAAVSYSKMNPATAKSESWLELIDVNTSQNIRTYQGGTAIGGIQWAPKSNLFAYEESNDGKSTVWIVNLPNGTVTPILRDVENFGYFQWSPDEQFMIYSITDEAEKNDTGLKRLQSPRDRWSSFRNNSFLYRVNLPDGSRQRLTAGNLGTSLQSIHPNGSKLLFSTSVDDYEHRPYTKTALIELDLESLAVDTLFEEMWFGNVQYSPDGKQLLLTGSARLFNNKGVNLPEGMIPNDYDSQAFLYSLGDGAVTAFTREFDPTIDGATWSPDGRSIYLTVGEGEYVRLYKYHLSDGAFEPIKSGFDVINSVDVARRAQIAVVYGSSAQMPHRVHIIDLAKKRHSTLSDPAAKEFENVRFGDLKDFKFTNVDGKTIDGRVYYPPNFDPAKKYPAIVYYYGGTSVTDRSFGGRYPKNLYTAQGYVVYVLQPSGAPGYGQEFSALHVNDWGNKAADDILTGVEKFLDAHPFVDRDRVGNMGASYGGYMTMHLVTRSNIFAAAVSHAGISSIASYWGEGNWGYLYSSVATAESFPWNRKDIYVNQSPLFNADKVTTPILLLHGDSDTNVPRGESDQFYVALKLLGKTVEYVRVAGQDHHILDYRKRLLWQNSIFAWFDKYLKNQPEWWNELYKNQ